MTTSHLARSHNGRPSSMRRVAVALLLGCSLALAGCGSTTSTPDAAQDATAAQGEAEAEDAAQGEAAEEEAVTRPSADEFRGTVSMTSTGYEPTTYAIGEGEATGSYQSGLADAGGEVERFVVDWSAPVEDARELDTTLVYELGATQESVADPDFSTYVNNGYFQTLFLPSGIASGDPTGYLGTIRVYEFSTPDGTSLYPASLSLSQFLPDGTVASYGNVSEFSSLEEALAAYDTSTSDFSAYASEGTEGTWELGEDGSIAVHMTYEDGSSSDYVLTYAE